MKKRILSVFMSLCIVVAMLPAPALAADDHQGEEDPTPPASSIAAKTGSTTWTGWSTIDYDGKTAGNPIALVLFDEKVTPYTSATVSSSQNSFDLRCGTGYADTMDILYRLRAPYVQDMYWYEYDKTWPGEYAITFYSSSADGGAPVETMIDGKIQLSLGDSPIVPEDAALVCTTEQAQAGGADGTMTVRIQGTFEYGWYYCTLSDINSGSSDQNFWLFAGTDGKLYDNYYLETPFEESVPATCVPQLSLSKVTATISSDQKTQSISISPHITIAGNGVEDSSLQEISFEKENGAFSLEYGTTGFRNAAVNSSTGGGAITYSSSKPSVATVNSNGEVTAVNIGTTTITATAAAAGDYAETSVSYNLTVEPKEISAVATVSNKQYDGTTKATAAVNFTGLVGTDLMTADTDYQVTAYFVDPNAGNNKAVDVTVKLRWNSTTKNYTLADEEISATGNIIKADAQALPEQNAYIKYDDTLVKNVPVAELLPTDAGTQTYLIGKIEDPNGLLADGTSVDENGNVKFRLRDGLSASDVTQQAKISVAISSLNYETSNTEVIVHVASVSETVASGTSGENFAWELTDDGVLTITGTGPMPIWQEPSYVPWQYYQNEIRTVVISDGITNIGDFAFNGCTNLEHITIPASVVNFGTYGYSDVFAGCEKLISAGPVGGNYNIQFSWADEIPYYAFHGCTSLTSVTIPDGVTSIRFQAFEGCSNLASVVIPKSVSEIEFNAFRDCTSLTSITIPEGVTTLGDAAFANCTNLERIVIPASVSNMPGGSTSDKGAFVGCDKLISAGPTGGNYNIQFSWTDEIPADAFGGCSNLTSVTIPDGVTGILDSAFSNCSSLTSITLPDSLTRIGSDAFTGCGSLASIVIPGRVTDIGNGAFSNCDKLTNAGPTGGNYNLQFGWTEAIPANAFSGCRCLTSVIIPESVVSIGEDAFSDCSSLINVDLPEGVTSIGDDAFRNCSNLINITIPSSVTNIGDVGNTAHLYGTAFYGCDKLISAGPIGGGYNIELGQMEVIPAFAFSNLPNLTSIIIPDGVRSIGENSFAFCDALTSISLPDSLISIGNSAFFSCSKLTNIAVPDGVTSIEDYSFAGCDALTDISLPDSVTSIGKDAFPDSYNKLKDVYYAGSESQWEHISIKYPNDWLDTTIIHYNSTGPDGTNPGGSDQATSSVHFFSFWNPDTKQAFFGNNSPVYSVAETVDTSAIDALVGKYVLVETDEANVFQITSMKPVESKIGTVLDVGENLISFETGVYLPTSSNLILSPYEGKTVLYHIYENKIVAINILEERTGTFDGWDGTTEQATIDGTVYPINFLTDRSFLGSLEEYWGENVTYFVCGDEAYKPLIRIDGIVETEKGIAVFSTEKSLTVQTGEFMGLAFGKTVNGEIDGGWRQMAIVVSDPTVISLTEYEEEEYGYLLKVFGKKQGATNVTITDTESGASTSIVITVRDAYAETYSYEIDNMQTFYPNNNWEDHVQTNIYDLNGLYVNNYQCRKTGDTYTVSFDAYNQRYHTGAVDIYDADGNWIKSEEIAKMEMISSLWDTGEQVFYLISNSMGGKILTYQQAASSKYTRLSFEVPDGGYFTISNNYAESPGTFLFNSCDILFDGVCDLIDVGVDGTEKSSFMKLIMGEFEDNKTLRESFIKAFKSTVEGQARTFAQQILEFELADASSNITQQLENLFKTLGLDWKNLFKFAANVGEGTILDKMGPAGLALKGCFEFSKGGSKLTQVFNIAGSVDAPYANVYSSIEEGYVNKHGVIVNTNGNMDAEAVLQVFRISNDHTIEVILDGSGGDRPKDYVLYNICFVKDDQLVQPSGKVSVRIPIPEWMDSDTCDVYRQEEDGNWTPLTAQIEGNYLVFETDHFSLYGVVGELSELKISSFPNQTQYSVGDIFNPDGLVLSLNGDLIDTGFICDPMILSEPGTQKITVRYGIASTEFTIFVQANTSGDGSDKPILGVYTITFNANLGNWGDNITSKEVKTGTDSKLAAAPENPTRNGYIFDGWFSAATGGEEVSNLSAYVFTEDTTLYAQWIRRSSSSSVGESSSSGYTVTVANTDNGSIRVNPTRAEEGDTVTITATPGPGYEVGEIIVTDRNGREIAVRNIGNNRYTFKMPSGQVKVDATFVRIEGTAPQIIFQDVIAGTYYYDAVLWAVEQGITSGVTATTFNPNGSCTRAQIVTFLWRANGSPAPQTSMNPFTDISPDAYYYDAVLWAVEQGITSGTTATSFNPDKACTRAQAVTFLWRSEGSPAADNSSFNDVPDGTYYADAVDWAVANNVTQGITTNTFVPSNTCTRAQIVTFLYRTLV